MLLPTAVDLLRCIERTLETAIVPTLTGTAERSAAATIGHLLRHVALRIQHEGELFALEIDKLRPLLEQAAGVIRDDFAQAPDSKRTLDALKEALARPAPPTHGYRDLASLTAEVTALRQGVCDALELLQRHESDLSAAAKDLYDSLKRYVTWELDNESKLIDPAFEGFGPRR
jgi:hypothetical protein